MSSRSSSTDQLDALLGEVAFTGPVREAAAPDAGVLLALADAVRHRRPVRMRYAGGGADVSGLPIRTRLPASAATIEELSDAECHRVALRAERLDWLPGVLATLDRPFVIEHPDELRDLVRELAGRLARSAHEAPVER